MVHQENIPNRISLHPQVSVGGVSVGGVVASWLVSSSSDREFRELTRDFVLCSLARHFTPTVPLSTPVYK